MKNEAQFRHRAVLLEEAGQFLNCRKGGTYIDATCGGGGYAKSILEKIGRNGRLICLDLDEKALEAAEKLLERTGRGKKADERKKNFYLMRMNFKDMKRSAQDLGIKGVDGVAFDLGLSSPQIDRPEYGLSYKQDSPLDMRLDRTQKLTADQIVNKKSAQELGRIFFSYGQERWSKIIAKAIEKASRLKPLKTSRQLVDIIRKALPGKGLAHLNKTLARIFQALRIAVNDELENLRQGLEAARQLLNPGGRLVVVSYHSLEDKAVKDFFRIHSRGCVCPAWVPVCQCGRKPSLRILTKKPVYPRPAQVRANPRSRSARLRAAEKI